MPNTKGNLVITSQHANKDIADDTAHVEKFMAKLKSLMLVHVRVLWLLLPLQAQYQHLLIGSQDPRPEKHTQSGRSSSSSLSHWFFTKHSFLPQGLRKSVIIEIEVFSSETQVPNIKQPCNRKPQVTSHYRTCSVGKQENGYFGNDHSFPGDPLPQAAQPACREK